jgi:arylsulfatase A-like enzyme
MADADKPNILVIWGDDIGITNLSCYSDGLMGGDHLPPLSAPG